MTQMMLERSAETGRKLALLLERGLGVRITRDPARALVTVRVDDGRMPPRWYDGGTLDAAVAQIEVAA